MIKSKFCNLCYQAFTGYHHNVFISILPLSEGRVGVAWEPSNKKCFSPPKINSLSLLPRNFLFASNLILSFITLFLSLFGCKGLCNFCVDINNKHKQNLPVSSINKIYDRNNRSTYFPFVDFVQTSTIFQKLQLLFTKV